MPRFFGAAGTKPAITAPTTSRFSPKSTMRRGYRSMRSHRPPRCVPQGADLIDVGCDPGGPWAGVAETVRALKDAGHRVSIDSLDPREIAPAVRARHELVLSVNSTNREAALDWGCRWFVVPDVPETLAGLDETVEFLATAGVRLPSTPSSSPSASASPAAGRYLTVRSLSRCRNDDGHRQPPELTDADSAASINVLLLEAAARNSASAASSPRGSSTGLAAACECDLGRRLAHYAVKHRSLPKHVEPEARDTRPRCSNSATNNSIACREIKDQNYRLFAEGGKLHIVGRAASHGHRRVRTFRALLSQGVTNVDANHAFYLGYELAKAATACLTLGKHYRQDQA